MHNFPINYSTFFNLRLNNIKVVTVISLLDNVFPFGHLSLEHGINHFLHLFLSIKNTHKINKNIPTSNLTTNLLYHFCIHKKIYRTCVNILTSGNTKQNFFVKETSKYDVFLFFIISFPLYSTTFYFEISHKKTLCRSNHSFPKKNMFRHKHACFKLLKVLQNIHLFQKKYLLTT